MINIAFKTFLITLIPTLSCAMESDMYQRALGDLQTRYAQQNTVSPDSLGRRNLSLRNAAPGGQPTSPFLNAPYLYSPRKRSAEEAFRPSPEPVAISNKQIEADNYAGAKRVKTVNNSNQRLGQIIVDEEEEPVSLNVLTKQAQTIVPDESTLIKEEVNKLNRNFDEFYTKYSRAEMEKITTYFEKLSGSHFLAEWLNYLSRFHVLDGEEKSFFCMDSQCLHLWFYCEGSLFFHLIENHVLPSKPPIEISSSSRRKRALDALQAPGARDMQAPHSFVFESPPLDLPIIVKSNVAEDTQSSASVPSSPMLTESELIEKVKNILAKIDKEHAFAIRKGFRNKKFKNLFMKPEHHADKHDLPQSRREYACPHVMCLKDKKVFLSADSLFFHIADEHFLRLGQATSHCKKCNCFFNRPMHKCTTRKQNTSCKICQMTFEQRGIFINHVKVVHSLPGTGYSVETLLNFNCGCVDKRSQKNFLAHMDSTHSLNVDVDFVPISIEAFREAAADFFEEGIKQARLLVFAQQKPMAKESDEVSNGPHFSPTLPRLGQEYEVTQIDESPLIFTLNVDGNSPTLPKNKISRQHVHFSEAENKQNGDELTPSLQLTLQSEEKDYSLSKPSESETEEFLKSLGADSEDAEDEFLNLLRGTSEID